MNKKAVMFLSIFVILGAISFFVDKEIIVFASSLQFYELTNFFTGIILLSSEIILILFLSFLFLCSKEKRENILLLWFTMGISVAVGFFLKILIHRTRPFNQGLSPVLEFLFQNSHFTWNFSFPSFHAILLFSTLPLISKKFPKIKPFWIFLIIIFLFARLYFGLHFLSDILFGALIGFLLGKITLKLEEENKFFEEIYFKILRKIKK
jgi:undecaprenyl-diphosphatase